MRLKSRPKWMVLAACVAAACLPVAFAESTSSPGVSSAPDQSAQREARRLLADHLVDAAYSRSSDSALSTTRAAQEATILLQFAHHVEPDNIHTLKLLAEAARTSGTPESTEVRRDALRTITRLDPGDLVNQVALLDLIASASQAIDERARIYRAALDSAALDAQIRSQMALRLAHIASERDEKEQARDFLRQALSLNDVNVEALRDLARLSDRAPEHHLAALIALLNADPYQPDVWVGAATELGSAGVHDQAADFLVIALEQMELAGEEPSGELYLQLAMEYGAAGRTTEAVPILASLAKLPDSPLSALMAAQLLGSELGLASGKSIDAANVPAAGFTISMAPPSTAPATAPATAPTTAPAPTPATAPATSAAGSAGSSTAAATAPAPPEPLPSRVLKRLTQSVEADPKASAPLAQAIWIELSAMPEVAPETDGWLRSYASMVPKDDPTLARLNGWELLRDKKLPEAQAALEKLASSDPLAQLGLAKTFIEDNKADLAAKQLQDLWNAHPTGLLAFQVAQTARLAHIALQPTGLTRQVADITRSLNSRVTIAHRQPREWELISATLSNRSYDLGQPVSLTVRLTNSTDHAVPVGPDGVIKTSLGLIAAARGLDSKSLGMYAVEDLQRVYRLEPRATIEATVRADAGFLANIFQARPIQTLTFGISAIIAPRGSAAVPVPGLGGQRLTIGDFDRLGMPMQTELINKLIREAASTTLDKQMLRAQMMGALIVGLPKDSGPPHSPEETARADAMHAVRVSIINMLQDFSKSTSPLLRAWILQVVPQSLTSDALDASLDGMASDPDPVVRVFWTMRQASISHGPPEGRKAALLKIAAQLDLEKDPLVHQWMVTTLDDEIAADAAKTQPATNKAPGGSGSVKP